EAGAGVLGLQQGIVNDGAAELAAAAGLSVVMDTCIMVAHRSMKLGF
ncbi:MAG: CoA-binding protein, partial [Chloroflexi bacterium]|nr:CoA-binding protein [Chloroflexota bacterium]